MVLFSICLIENLSFFIQIWGNFHIFRKILDEKFWCFREKCFSYLLIQPGAAFGLSSDAVNDIEVFLIPINWRHRFPSRVSNIHVDVQIAKISISEISFPFSISPEMGKGNRNYPGRRIYRTSLVSKGYFVLVKRSLAMSCFCVG